MRRFLRSLLALVLGPSKSPLDPVRRDGQPDMYRVGDEDDAMEAAVLDARRTLDAFTAALHAPTPEQTSFAVKKPVRDGDLVEHVWLSDPSFDGEVFRGRVDNEPVDVTTVAMGDVVAVSAGEISDWFYVDHGKLVGGWTLRVLYGRMSADEKRDFREHLDFSIE